MISVKKQFQPLKPFRFQQLNKSKGILDDHAVRKSVNTREGSITAVPTEEIDIVNKKYVDSLIRGNVELFLTEDASDIGGYFDLAVDSTGNPEEEITQAITGNSTTLIAAFASILNEAEIEAITNLELGIYSAHLHVSANFPNGMTVYFEFYRRTSLGAETLIGTSHDSDVLGTSESQQELHANISTDLIWDTGDRIVVKIYGRNSNAASKNITLFTEGDTLSRVEFPAFIPPTSVGAHDMASHTDDNTYNINTSGTATIGNIIYADGNVAGIGLDVLRSANITINLEIGQDLTVVRNIIVSGTVDGVDIAARDHAESHSVASHNDTTATGAELDTLTDNSIADTLHRHSELVASDGSPDPAFSIDSSGIVDITTQSRFSARSDIARSMANNAWTTVIFVTEDYDSQGEYFAATGIFTATVAGYYAVSWSVVSDNVAWAVGERWVAGVSKEDSTVTGGFWLGSDTRAQAAFTGRQSSVGSAHVFLAATDTLRIKVFQNQGVAVNTHNDGRDTFFMVHKLS